MKRDKGLDLVRCIACLFIIVFHFSIEEIGGHTFRTTLPTSNIDLGHIGVALFFILSGASLYVSMEKYKDSSRGKKIATYIYKRFKGIFPAFWSAYLLIFLFTFIMKGGFDSTIPKESIWMSLVGMDGLLLYLGPNFYMTGEWYIGAMIIVYLYYPFLKMLIDKLPKLSLIIIPALYIVFMVVYDFDLMFYRHPLAQILWISFGIYFAKYVILGKGLGSKLRWILFGVSVAVFVVFSLVPIEQFYFHATIINAMGIAMFFILYNLAFVMKNKAVDKVVTTISVYSYPIFLVHHAIVYALRDGFTDLTFNRAEYITCFVLYLVLIVPCAMVVKWMAKKFVEIIEMIPKRAC